MKAKTILTCVCVGLFVCIFIPADLLATTVGDSIEIKGIEKDTSMIKNLLFGPPMKIAGVLGGAYGLFQSIVGASIKPVLAFGGIGLAANIVPKFIDAVFSLSGMLVP